MSSDEEKINECVRCGNCTELCPTFAESLAEGRGPRGRIALLQRLQTGDLPRSRTLDDRIFSCMLCGACNDRCPAGIRITEAVYAGRQSLRRQSGPIDFTATFIRHAFRHAPQAFRLFRALQGLGSLRPLRSIAAVRTFRSLGIELPPSAFRDAGAVYRVPNARGRIAIFTGCTTDFLYPSLGRMLVESLQALRYDVVVPKGEVCCGAPLLSLGFRDDVAALAEKNVELFRKLRVEAVISLCPTCVHFIRDVYTDIAGAGIEHAMDDAAFFIQHAEMFQASTTMRKSAYHAPCHTRNHLGSDATARAILDSAGCELIKTDPGCCGFGGAFAVLYEEMSIAMRQKRLAAYQSADTIITSCPNCMIQFQNSCGQSRLRHTIEIIHQALTGART